MYIVQDWTDLKSQICLRNSLKSGLFWLGRAFLNLDTSSAVLASPSTRDWTDKIFHNLYGITWIFNLIWYPISVSGRILQISRILIIYNFTSYNFVLNASFNNNKKIFRLKSTRPELDYPVNRCNLSTVLVYLESNKVTNVSQQVHVVLAH